MDNVNNENENSNIKAEHNNTSTYDGGFEALLDEFGPENDTLSKAMTDDGIGDPENPEEMSVTEPEADPIRDPPPDVAEASPGPEETLEQQSMETMDPSPEPSAELPPEPSTEMNEESPAPNPSAPPTSTSADQSKDNKFMIKKMDTRKQRRRTKRMLARAAQLVLANGDLSKLTIPIAENKDPAQNPVISGNGHCELYIFPHDYPATEINNEEFQMLQDKIMMMLRDTINYSDNWCPKFLDCVLKDGSVLMNCVDITTRHWVIVTLPKLELWPDAKLVTVDAVNLVNLTRVSVKIKQTKLDNQAILGLFQKQNDVINTGKWMVFNRSDPDDNGIVTLVIGIDPFSMKNLRDCNGKLFFGLGRVQFDLPPPKKDTNFVPKTNQPGKAFDKGMKNNQSPVNKGGIGQSNIGGGRMSGNTQTTFGSSMNTPWSGNLSRAPIMKPQVANMNNSRAMNDGRGTYSRDYKMHNRQRNDGGSHLNIPPWQQ